MASIKLDFFLNHQYNWPACDSSYLSPFQQHILGKRAPVRGRVYGVPKLAALGAAQPHLIP